MRRNPGTLSSLVLAAFIAVTLVWSPPSANALSEEDLKKLYRSGECRCSSVRTVTQLAVTSDCLDRIEHVRIEIEADGFLYHMVRNIVGTLVEVGKGARNEDWPAEVQRARDRRRAGRTAPALGLFLVLVRYGNAEARSSG